MPNPGSIAGRSDFRFDCPLACDGEHAGKRDCRIDAETTPVSFVCEAQTCGIRELLANRRPVDLPSESHRNAFTRSPGSTTNRERIERIETMLEQNEFQAPSEALIDLLSDCQHWCHAQGIDFTRSIALAEQHFQEEFDREETAEG